MTSAPAILSKRVTWLELFFDLVFVFAVTRTSELLQDDHTWMGAVRAVIVFVPVYWVWVGTTMHANLHEVDTIRGRLEVLGVGLCGLVLALALPEAWGAGGVWFGAAYWAARLVLYLTLFGRPHRFAFRAFVVAAFVTGPLLVVGGLLAPDVRIFVWALAAITDLGVPYLGRKALAGVPFVPSHLTERFGTFVIIALGETMVATGAAAGQHELDLVRLLAVAAAFVVTGGLWWVYFAYSPKAIEDALEAAPARIEIIRPVLSYGHLAMVGGIVGVAAAIGAVVEGPDEPPRADIAMLLFGGTALYLVTFAFTRWRLFHTLAVPRLAAAACCLALAAVAPAFPAVVDLGGLAALVVVLCVVEHYVLPRTLQRGTERTKEDR